jgi:hypothetical protein
MKIASVCGLLAIVAFFPVLAQAQFNFGFGGGNNNHSHGYGNQGGGISIGFGTGGISIGSGRQPSWGDHGHSHGHSDGYPRPQWGIEFNTGPSWNNYPTHDHYHRPTRPVPQYREPAVIERPKPTPKPVANVKPAVTDPKENKIRLVGRHISADEIARAKEFFKQRLDELAKTIEKQLPAADVDIGKVLAQLVAKEVEADLQIRLIDALRGGDIDRAREIWIAACPGEAVPFGMPRMRIRFASFYERLSDGTCTMEDVEELHGDLATMGMNEEPCCGAESLLQDIEEHLRISQAVARAVPGKASLSVAIPAGEVEIAYHPGLPDGSVVVLDAETVMVGTGGVGKFEMERGNVAAAVGYPLSMGQPLPDNESKLVRSGVLIENPTNDTVNYLVDSSQFSMQPGYRQALTASSSVIKFDRGNGGKAATYKLAPGTYRFVIKNRAWDMYQAKFAVTIDNSQNSEPFQYIVQGEHAAVAAGQSQTHKSSYPIIIRFDRGNGGATKQVLFEETEGTLEVAVNLADNMWDLFGSSRATDKPDAPPAADYTPAF